jgi:hypothetical protein
MLASGFATGGIAASGPVCMVGESRNATSLSRHQTFRYEALAPARARIAPAVVLPSQRVGAVPVRPHQRICYFHHPKDHPGYTHLEAVRRALHRSAFPLVPVTGVDAQ